ncbi:MAG: preprotein translocase subunit SecG [Xanthobacteraceae bacterium]
MHYVLIVIHLMVVLAMIGAVLLQKSEGGGLGMGGGGGGFLTSRGTANVLTRTTAILAVVFFATSLGLSILAGIERKPSSILSGGTPSSSQPLPGGPQTPLGQGSGGILQQLQGRGQGQAPPPAEPEVPPSR